MFECDRCGMCCRNVGSITVDMGEQLDRGDGVCKYLDCESNLCSIYEKRPILCNVDKVYELYFADKLCREEYYLLNNKVCKKLKQKYDAD